MIQIDMEMPKNCLDCNLRYQSFCSVDGHHEPHLEKERCPLKVTPQPCEDAVSRQAVLDLIADYDLSMGQVVRGIHALPSVTPQESVKKLSHRKARIRNDK